MLNGIEADPLEALGVSRHVNLLRAPLEWPAADRAREMMRQCGVRVESQPARELAALLTLRLAYTRLRQERGGVMRPMHLELGVYADLHPVTKAMVAALNSAVKRIAAEQIRGRGDDELSNDDIEEIAIAALRISVAAANGRAIR